MQPGQFVSFLGVEGNIVACKTKHFHQCCATSFNIELDTYYDEGMKVKNNILQNEEKVLTIANSEELRPDYFQSNLKLRRNLFRAVLPILSVNPSVLTIFRELH